MRTSVKVALASLAAIVLCLGAFSPVAVAGKKKKTVVVFFTSSPKFNKSGKANAKGTLNTASVCKSSRGMRLQVTDANGLVLATLDGSTSDSSGNWALSGHLPTTLPPGTNYVRVKATKRTVGKFVCKAGVSPSVPIPVI
jgi:hypothetical protein